MTAVCGQYSSPEPGPGIESGQHTADPDLVRARGVARRGGGFLGGIRDCHFLPRDLVPSKERIDEHRHGAQDVSATHASARWNKGRVVVEEDVVVVWERDADLFVGLRSGMQLYGSHETGDAVVLETTGLIRIGQRAPAPSGIGKVAARLGWPCAVGGIDKAPHAVTPFARRDSKLDLEEERREDTHSQEGTMGKGLGGGAMGNAHMRAFRLAPGSRTLEPLPRRASCIL